MPQALDNIASRLRAAVLQSDHNNARRLTAEYTHAVRRCWEALSPAERTRSELPKLSIELLTWVRQMTLLQQAIAAQHLAIAEKVGRYQKARAVYVRAAALDPQS